MRFMSSVSACFGAVLSAAYAAPLVHLPAPILSRASNVTAHASNDTDPGLADACDIFTAALPLLESVLAKRDGAVSVPDVLRRGEGLSIDGISDLASFATCLNKLFPNATFTPDDGIDVEPGKGSGDSGIQGNGGGSPGSTDSGDTQTGGGDSDVPASPSGGAPADPGAVDPGDAGAGGDDGGAAAAADR